MAGSGVPLLSDGAKSMQFLSLFGFRNISTHVIQKGLRKCVA